MIKLKSLIKEIEQFDLTQTSEFKRWFGNSKVVDSNGKPRIVYHGTDKNFRVFNIKKTTQGIIWATTNKSEIENGESGAQGRGKIMNLYVRIENPAGWAEYEKYSLGELKSMGYDGAILPEGNQFTAFVFEPNQIKSVNNIGTFDPSNKDITKENIEDDSLLEQVKKSLYEYEDYTNWKDFVDHQELGYCQNIVSDIIRNFSQFKKVLGEIEVDHPYIDEEGNEQYRMIHHWVSLNGKSYDFSKGTLKEFIDFTGNEIYDVNVNDAWRYHKGV